MALCSDCHCLLRLLGLLFPRLLPGKRGEIVSMSSVISSKTSFVNNPGLNQGLS